MKRFPVDTTKFRIGPAGLGATALAAIVLGGAAAIVSTSRASASDWEEDGTNFVVPPRRPAKQQPQQPEEDWKPSQSNGPQKMGPGHTLEGNISHTRPGRGDPSFGPYGAGAGLGVPGDLLLEQTPIPAMPKTIAVSPTVFKTWLQKTHPELTATLSNMNKDTVVEVKGAWDDAGHTMRSFGIPYTRIGAGKLGTADLSATKILVVNCAGDVPPAGIQKLQRFVRNGGWLLTTDWALGCVERAFPGYISWNGGYTESRVVDAVVVDPDPALFRNTVPYAFWKLDSKSQTLRVMRQDGVHVLARSRMLLTDDPSQLGVLAVTFSYGRGNVLHLVGHFDNNSDRAFNNALPDPAPKIGISLRQALAANFMAEAIQSNAPTQQ